jgi:uncharacterized protein (TIRG00374 family)
VALALVVEFFLVPRLVAAARDVNLLAGIRPAWAAAAVALEAASLYAYALLTRTLLTTHRPSRWWLFRMTLSTTGISHALPAGGVTGQGTAVQLLTASGVATTEAGFVVVAGALWSAVVLNALLWVALVASIPLAGVHPVYLVVAGAGVAAMVVVALVVVAVTRGQGSAIRMVRWVGRRVPRLGADRLEAQVRRVAELLTQLLGSRAVLARATLWAALNWLLDAATLATFLAALGQPVHPVELFVAYGIGNVLAAVPVVPGGLGVVEASTASLLAGFGVPATVATLGVLAWRLAEFWLPIPVGGLAHVSLRLSAGRRARSEAGGPEDSGRGIER